MAKPEETSPETQPEAPVRPQLSIHAQYVKDLSFESPSTPEVFITEIGKPAAQINFNVSATRLENNHFEVVLKIGAQAKTEEKTFFVIDLSYAGIVSSNVDDARTNHPLILIEGPRLIFPFARALISDITREGGFLPLNLNPIDFVALYRNNMQNRAKNEAENSTQNGAVEGVDSGNISLGDDLGDMDSGDNDSGDDKKSQKKKK